MTKETADNLTPKYLRLLDTMPLSEKKILTRLAECDRPMMASEIGRLCRETSSYVSSVLKRLRVEDGLVSITHKIGKWVYFYEVRDREFCEWWKLRRGING